MAVNKWRPYLHGQQFTIRTDHHSLLHLTAQAVHSKIQQKALLKLMDLQYTIQYKKGITNAAADALSRAPETSTILSIFISTPSWMDNCNKVMKRMKRQNFC